MDNGSPIEKDQASELRSPIPLLLIILTTLLCFGNSLPGQFVGDDHIVVERNDKIRSLSSVPKLFLQSYWGEGYKEHGNYRPLTGVSFALNYAIGGLEPLGYRLLNLFLHALNGFLVFVLARHYTKRDFLSFAAALLFIVHPVHVEAVAQISGRTELLAAAFALASWICYIDKERKIAYYFLSLAFYFFALLAKESAIVLLGVLALADLCSQWDVWRRNIPKLCRYYAGFVAVASFYVLLRFLVIGKLGVDPQWTFFKDESTATRVFTMSQAFLKYFQLLLWPYRLNSFYDYSIIPLAASVTASVALSLAVVSAVLAFGVILLRRERLIAFAVLFFFVAMSTASNIVFPTGILMAERVLYLPAISVCLIAGDALDRLYKRGGTLKRVSILLCVIAVAAIGARSFIRGFDWLDDASIAAACVRDAPESPIARMSLGIVYSQFLQFDDAEREFKKAIELAPDRAATHGRLGELYVLQKRFDEAYPELMRSLELSDRFEFVHIAMARVYNQRAEYAQAVEAYRKGIAMSPPDAALHQELALTLLKIGNNESAITELLEALKLNPESEELHNNLGAAYGRLGRYEEAKQEFEAALRINPGYANAAKNLERLSEIMKKE